MKRWRKHLTAFAVLAAVAVPANAETVALRVAKQPGVTYLPMTIMEQEQLVEKHAAERGVDTSVEWLTFTGGSAMNESLISGSLDIASGGIPPLITIWAKTQKNLKVKGIAPLGAQPQYLLTTNPDVKTIADFTSADKIAVPAVKVSNQAIMLQMAAKKELGMDKVNALDPFTVSMGHPDAMAAMLGGSGGVNSHFGQTPYQDLEMRDPRVHIVLNSWDVVGSPFPIATTWATSDFVEENPELVAAFVDALREAQQKIVTDPNYAAKVWVANEGSNLTLEEAEKILRNPDFTWDTTPRNTLTFLKHMNEVGLIEQTTDDWRDFFFDYVKEEPGS